MDIQLNNPLFFLIIYRIRVIPVTISKTVMVKRVNFYKRNLGDIPNFWMAVYELAQATDADKQGYSDLGNIIRNAYDFGRRFGLNFASNNSNSAIVDIKTCSMFFFPKCP